jgi:hypothetical protein
MAGNHTRDEFPLIKRRIIMNNAKQKWNESKKKLGDLQNEKDEVQRKIGEIDGKIREVRSTKQSDAVATAAQLLLDGKYTRPEDVNPLFQERDDLAIRRKVLFEAIRLQEEIVNNVRMEYSRLVGQSRKDEYAVIVRQMVKAVIDLSRAIEREIAFRDDFRAQGISFEAGFRQTLMFTRHGVLSDRNSRAQMYLREVITSGKITKEEVERMVAS